MFPESKRALSLTRKFPVPKDLNNIHFLIKYTTSRRKKKIKIKMWNDCTYRSVISKVSRGTKRGPLAGKKEEGGSVWCTPRVIDRAGAHIGFGDSSWLPWSLRCFVLSSRWRRCPGTHVDPHKPITDSFLLEIQRIRLDIEHDIRLKLIKYTNWG